MSLTISHILDGLNESQKRAVTSAEGPVFIVAGPGTGKTLTIVRRIAYLIHKGIRPENILSVTFTNRAAREMRERTGALLGSDSDKVFIGTLHLLGLKIIKDTRPDSFIFYNREEQLNLLKKLVRDSDSRGFQGGRRYNYVQIGERISRIKNLLDDADEEIKKIYEEYQNAIAKDAALDFDDLILKPVELLGDSAVSDKYRDFFRYIMVDEYQDINPAQYKLLTLLAQGNNNLCAIGDPDQAVYSFRGAGVGNFMKFEKDFQDVKSITLTDNYRSTGVILDASNDLIKNNMKRLDKELRATRERGVPVTVISVPDERAEGELIVREIEGRIGGTSHYQLYSSETKAQPEGKIFGQCSYNFSDFAVIYRTNAQAKVLGESFHESGIPYRVIGEKYLAKKRGIDNFILFLRVLINPSDASGFQRISRLPEGADMALIEKCKELKNTLPFDEFLKAVWRESGIKKYCAEEDFMFLEDLAVPHCDMEPEDALNRLINELSLLTPADDFDSGADAVTLMTLHMAKGLEFKVVFIAGVEEGLIPYAMRKEDVDIEEERRLFYVGMTRAMDELFLIHGRNRFIYGRRLAQSPSSFLKEVPGVFTEHRFIADRVKKRPKDNQIGLF